MYSWEDVIAGEYVVVLTVSDDTYQQFTRYCEHSKAAVGKLKESVVIGTQEFAIGFGGSLEESLLDLESRIGRHEITPALIEQYDDNLLQLTKQP